MALFEQLELKNWRQFDSVELDLERQTTVITGTNGCGKTTILNVLSRHFGWNLNFVSTPYMGKKKSKKFWSDIFRSFREDTSVQPNSVEVGKIKYNSGDFCSLTVPQAASNGPQYQLTYDNQKQVVGLHIPSHRPAITYQPVPNIPTDPKNNQQHYQEFQNLLLQTYGSQNVRNPGLILKQSLISLAMFGYGNEAIAENYENRNLFETFQEVLTNILPDNLGFKKIEIRMPDVVLVTDSGDFSLDAMSGGVSSLFGIAWQIHMYQCRFLNSLFYTRRRIVAV